MKKNSVKEFIEKARKVHGDKYDYSKVEYINNSTKICIICPIHGEFWQTPANHLFGQGCKKCGIECKSNKRRKTTEQFVEEARAIHGDKYDYSNVEYVSTDKKIKIVCPIHGVFEQTPYHHLKGNGCPKCSKNLKKTTEQFVEEARAIHGDKYDYSKVVYNGANNKVCIICPKHGEFWQKPSMHLIRRGCPKCVGKNKTTEQFVEEARAIHGDKYDYSKTEYNGAFRKVTIICPIHGEFKQRPHDHLRGCGCFICNQSKLENEVKVFLNNKYVFEEQKRFEWLGKQSLDFYLPQYNVAIECQGIQHFENVTFFKNNLSQIKKNDLKKYQLCKENGIKIIYYTNNFYLKYSNSLEIYNNNLFSDLTVIKKIYFNNTRQD